MSNLAPGTYVQESDFPSFNPVNTGGGSAFVFVGAHNQGPLTPQLVASWGQFVNLFGGFAANQVPSLLALAVYSFFNNGGSQCYVVRIVHTDAAPAEAMLEDTGGDATLQVTATNPGAWGNNVHLVTTVNATTSRFSVAVYVGGTQANQLAESVWTNLSMSPGDSRYAPNVINNPLNGSKFIRVVDQAANPIVTPGPLPAAGTTILGAGTGNTAGTDGSAAVAADLIGSQTQLDTLRQGLVVNFPGVTDTTAVLGPMLSYLTTGRPWPDSVLVVDPPSGQTPAAVMSYVSQLSASSYAVPYYPWVTVADPSSQTSGALRTLPPGAFAMAKWSVNDASRGVWKAPAGHTTPLSALATETVLLPGDVGNLTAAGINCIRFIEGAGIVLWGARTLSNVEQTRYVNVRRLLLYVESNLKALSEYAAFEDNDFFLWTQLSQRLGTFLSQLWASGAFAGQTQANSFFITCDESNNTADSDVVHIDVGVAAAKPAEFILISVGQWAGGSSINETTTAAAIGA